MAKQLQSNASTVEGQTSSFVVQDHVSLQMVLALAVGGSENLWPQWHIKEQKPLNKLICDSGIRQAVNSGFRFIETYAYGILVPTAATINIPDGLPN